MFKKIFVSCLMLASLTTHCPKGRLHKNPEPREDDHMPQNGYLANFNIAVAEIKAARKIIDQYNEQSPTAPKIRQEKAKRDRENAQRRLKNALSNAKTLRGIIASSKQISEEDKGRIEQKFQKIKQLPGQNVSDSDQESNASGSEQESHVSGSEQEFDHSDLDDQSSGE